MIKDFTAVTILLPSDSDCLHQSSFGGPISLSVGDGSHFGRPNSPTLAYQEIQQPFEKLNIDLAEFMAKHTRPIFQVKTTPILPQPVLALAGVDYLVGARVTKARMAPRSMTYNNLLVALASTLDHEPDHLDWLFTNRDMTVDEFLSTLGDRYFRTGDSRQPGRPREHVVRALTESMDGPVYRQFAKERVLIVSEALLPTDPEILAILNSPVEVVIALNLGARPKSDDKDSGTSLRGHVHTPT